MKRLIVCADGTWNIRDQLDKKTGTRRPTNVTKIARAIVTRASGIDQVVIYHDGVGTGRGLDKWTGGAFGDGIEQNIRELYRSIIYNFETGDELFFFGFSRGAFTVRSLVGFLSAVGLLAKGDDYWVPELYSCYEKGNRPGSPGWAAAMKGLEYPVRPCPAIKFLGVWDTVGALGAPGLLGQVFNRNRYAYHDISLNGNVLHAYQALAIDEHRKPFAPSVWSSPAGWSGTLEQAWFAGAHCDVGGGEPRDGLANQALHWLVEKAENQGLVFDSPYLGFFKPCFNGDMHDSMTTMYRAMGPITRAIGTQGANERIHQSALDRQSSPQCNYAPQNLAEFVKARPGEPPQGTSRIASRTPC